jgi:hypothetical protein
VILLDSLENDEYVNFYITIYVFIETFFAKSTKENGFPKPSKKITLMANEITFSIINNRTGCLIPTVIFD